jgi:glycosyltransferase involved in cell wall biosynthesis
MTTSRKQELLGLDGIPMAPKQGDASRPLITVVIPVFNGEATIARTIASVQAQTLGNLEILVINDGSQDGTMALVEQCAQADDRIQLFSYPNGGLACSRNRGIRRARGLFISFIDADDLWQPPKLEAQWQAIEANPQAGVAYSWTDFIDDDDQRLFSCLQTHHQGHVLEALLQRNFLDSGSNSLIRIELLVQGQTEPAPTDHGSIGTGFDESLPAAEDWEFHLRLAAKTEFVLVPEAHVLYRQGRSTMSTNVIRQGISAGNPEQLCDCTRRISRVKIQNPG